MYNLEPKFKINEIVSYVKEGKKDDFIHYFNTSINNPYEKNVIHTTSKLLKAISHNINDDILTGLIKESNLSKDEQKKVEKNLVEFHENGPNYQEIIKHDFDKMNPNLIKTNWKGTWNDYDHKLHYLV